MTDENGIDLDPEAQKLFAQLGGTESWIETRKDLISSDRLAKSLLQEQKRFDATRIALVRMAWLISRYLSNDAFAGQRNGESGVFQKLANVIAELAHMPGHLGSAFIRFRGAPADQNLPERYDYEVVLGNTSVDTLLAPRVARRCGPAQAKLPDQLLEAFTIFADYGVNNIMVVLTDARPAEMTALQMCLQVLSGFRTARQTGADIVVGSGQGQRQVPLINDENLFPDPNLTLMAGLNRLSTKSMEDLVFKVDSWLRQRRDRSGIDKYAGVYNAAIELPKLKARIRQPVIELNNVKWLISASESEEIPAAKLNIAQLAMESAGASPQIVAKMIKSIYGDDYAVLTTPLLGERLHLSSNLLNAAEKSKKRGDLSKELLGNLRMRLDTVKDQVIDDLQVREATESDFKADSATSGDVVHSQIFKMVSFYKGRSGTRKKMVGLVFKPIAFTERDYKILAQDFRISLEDARSLVDKLKSCFDQSGRFKKNTFNEAVEHFQIYEQKIFHFLWHHMKDAIMPGDRVAFLNALQTLTARMNQPKRAFKVLLEDICNDPENVQFSDNKAVMLANLILHRPEKSLANYEITPEDIVMNRHNLDEVVVEYAAWRIEKEREQFFTKIQTIHKKLIEAMRIGQSPEKQMPATVLLNLERELFIFLALVEGDTGKAILRSSVYEYGDPSAEIYHLKESQNLMGILLQNLRVALHALGSIGSARDTGLLENVKSQEENFQRLKKDPRHRSQARRISAWADEAMKLIRFRS